MTAAPFNRKTIEDALHDWIVAACELPPTSVRWENQASQKPAYPYVTLFCPTITTIGVDELRLRDVEDPDEGEEIEQLAAGQRRLTVSINAFALVNDPIVDARALSDRVRSSLGLPSILAALRAAGLAFVEAFPAQSLDALVDARFVSRAQMDVAFGLASNVVERVGYIGTVEVVESAELGAPFTLTLE